MTPSAFPCRPSPIISFVFHSCRMQTTHYFTTNGPADGGNSTMYPYSKGQLLILLCK